MTVKDTAQEKIFIFISTKEYSLTSVAPAGRPPKVTKELLQKESYKRVFRPPGRP